MLVSKSHSFNLGNNSKLWNHIPNFRDDVLIKCACCTMPIFGVKL
jgi:hypothetical protein